MRSFFETMSNKLIWIEYVPHDVSVLSGWCLNILKIVEMYKNADFSYYKLNTDKKNNNKKLT